MWSATNTISASGFGFLQYSSMAASFSSFELAAAEKILHAAHEENLKRGHQRRSAGAVENLGQIVFGEIEFEEAEVAQLGGNQVFEDGIAKALAEERLIAHEHVGRAQLARFQFADEALGLGKGSHG